MRAVLGVAILGLSACGTDQTRLSSGAAERSSAGAIAPSAAPGPPGCDAPEVEDGPTPDEATTRQLVTGSWLLCDTPSFFGTTDETGLLIADEGHWAKLTSTGPDTATEMTGTANRGTWQLVDTSAMNGPGHFQIDFTGLDGLLRLSAVRVIAPAKLLLDNNGVFVARYVPTDVTIGSPQLVATR